MKFPNHNPRSQAHAWERTAFEAQPRRDGAAYRSTYTDQQAEPAIHWVPRQSLGTSTGVQREVPKMPRSSEEIKACPI